MQKHTIYLKLTEYSHVTHLSAQFSKERQQISYICMYFVFVPFHFDPWHNVINTHLTDECTQMKYFTMITNKGWSSTKLSHITHLRLFQPLHLLNFLPQTLLSFNVSSFRNHVFEDHLITVMQEFALNKHALHAKQRLIVVFI